MHTSYDVLILVGLMMAAWAGQCGYAGEGNAWRKAASTTGVGTWLPSERKTFKDPVTGARVVAITTAKARDNKIYQTHPSWTHDGKYIVFASDRTGTQQLFAYRVSDGGIVQITDDPSTQVGQVYLSRKANRMCLAKGRALVELNLARVLSISRPGGGTSAEESERRICALPEGWGFSGTFSVDANDRWLYVGLAREGKDAWAIHRIDVATGKTLNVTPIPFRVGHLQANRGRPGVLMFCHETGGDAPQRMYVMKTPTAKPEPFYRETYDEWVTHEVWWGPDEALFTIWPKNDAMRAKPHGIARVRLADHSHAIINQYPYWHVCGVPGGRYAVGDTFAGELFLIDAKTGTKKLLTAGHRPKGATVHPHPSASPDGKQILFCSERFGNWDLMLVDLPE